MKTVFILGAGASVAAGAPLIPDFLKRAKQIHGQGKYGDAAPHIQDVLNAALVDLKPVQVKSKLNYQNIEELFSAADIGQLIGSFGSRSPEKIDDLRKSIIVFIHRTIEETIRIPFQGKRFNPPAGYDMLSNLVRTKVERTSRLGRNEVSFITFNYDTCLEYSLAFRSLGIDYGLSEPFQDNTDNNYQVKIPVLKLHGSINWAFCPKCRTIVPTEINPWKKESMLGLIDMPDSLPLSYYLRFGRYPHRCGSSLDSLPVLVPPTWNKSSSTDGGLKDVWRRAAKELGSAENIVVIGYSMPPTDSFFKYLFALGSDSDIHLEKFIVINGPTGRSTRPHFEALLGPMTSQGFVFYEHVFTGAENIIKEVLDIQ